MSQPSLKLPVIQNWSCHNCSGCCREHLIEITEVEKRRIEKQGWTAKDGISMERPVIQKIARGRYRLAHTADGACVFLNEDGLCRIHANFGESAKPLACRVYPYAYHPAGKEITVSLRFSCPSVVQNLGTPVARQSAGLRQVASEVIAGKKMAVAPPAIHGSQQLDWADFHRFLKALDDSFADESVNFAVRLMRVLTWLEVVEVSQFSTVRGAKLDDYLARLLAAARKAQPDNDLPVLKPGRSARTMFRQMVAQYARHDTEATARGGLKTKLRLAATAVRFATGRGRVPLMPEPASVSVAFGGNLRGESDAEAVPSTPAESRRSQQPSRRPSFADLEAPFSCRRPDVDELFTRYFRVKIQGIHFCGPAHYDTPLLEGFQSLALMYPITLWLAVLRAARRGDSRIELQDAQAALATTDHNFGYSPALGLRSALNRVRILARMQQVTAICGWYSR
ncbi:MAG: YkgJ family cysteine cluster protein [Planctomycetaceae bacterium]